MFVDAPETTSPGAAAPEVDTTAAPSNDAVDSLGLDQADLGTDQGAADEGDQTHDSTDQATDAEFEEVDYEGKKYNLPKELKDALMRNMDYTRKTQEIGETRRALEMQQQQFQQAVQLQQSFLQEHAQLTAVDAQLQQFAKVDWNALNQQDPVQAQQLFFQFSQLKDMSANLRNSLSHKEQQALEMQRAQLAKQAQESNAVLAREIKGWSKETHQKLSEYAVGMGFSPQDVANAVNPNIWKLLHKASQYDQIIAKTAQPPKPPAPPVKPAGALPTGKSTVKKDPTEMTDAEFAAHRRRVIAQRNR